MNETRARIVDLSCDLGEATTPADQVVEDELWPLITAANVACGGHVGDEQTMRHAVRQAKRHRVVLGAHPSYPDREHFGRRSLAIEPQVLYRSLLEQLRGLLVIATEEGVPLQRVKPHGALYNDLHRNEDLARLVTRTIRELDPSVAVVTSATSVLRRLASEEGIPVVTEAFADRRYRADGSLVPRSEAGALLTDPEEAAQQAIRLVRDGSVQAADQSEITIEFTTLCIHGDMAGAVERLRRIRLRLDEAGFLRNDVAG